MIEAVLQCLELEGTSCPRQRREAGRCAVFVLPAHFFTISPFVPAFIARWIFLMYNFARPANHKVEVETRLAARSCKNL